MTPDEKEFFERLRRCKTASEATLLYQTWAKKIMDQHFEKEADRILYGTGEETTWWKTESTEKDWVFQPVPFPPLADSYKFYRDVVAESASISKELDNAEIDRLIDSTRTKPE